VGGLIANKLAATGDFKLTIADSNEDQLKRVGEGCSVTSMWLDAEDTRTVKEALAKVDVVINACPAHVNGVVSQAAREQGCHYFDLSEDRSSVAAVRNISEGADSAFYPQCGVSPGFISMVTSALSQRLDAPRDIEVRLGALPRYPSNRLQYGLTWNAAGLFQEYTQRCDAIVDGKRVELSPLEGYEAFSLDGNQYEAFTTANGLGSLCESMEGSVRTLTFKTIRYPGHMDKMQLLLNDLGLRRRKHLFKSMIENNLPIISQDVVLIFITVNGLKRGRVVQESYVKKLYSQQVQGDEVSALQTASAEATCAMVDLLCAGVIPSRGYVRQEDVDLAVFSHNRFGRYFFAGQAQREAEIGNPIN